MLEVCMPQLSHAESRSHFALWVITSAPLILGFEYVSPPLAPNKLALFDIIFSPRAA